MHLGIKGEGLTPGAGAHILFSAPFMRQGRNEKKKNLLRMGKIANGVEG